MLELPERELLLDALIPPDGYALDFAVVTTYSLDLVALLTTPVAFSRWSIPDQASEELAGVDGMVLLNAVHEYANRMTVFCDAGRISVPHRIQPLLKFLEDVVVEVTAPAPGKVFHPKVWALRYTCHAAPVKYRLLVSSRNLTFSRSWDTMLSLDGDLTERTRAFGNNRPLGEFFDALPDMVLRQPVHPTAAARIAILAQELPRVAFDCPAGVTEVLFHPMGYGPKQVDPIVASADRILVVSPFLTPGRVGALGARGTENVLVSTIGALATMSPKDLARFDSVMVMRPDATFDTEATSSTDGMTTAELKGLHTKLYIAEKGWDAHVYTGSANATDAACNGNVEFLVELIGRRSILGIDKMLRAGAEREVTFRSLLQEFSVADDADTISSHVEEELERVLEAARWQLARCHWIVDATPCDAGGFDVEVGADGASQIAATVDALRVYPTTLPSERGRLIVVSSDSVVFPSEPLSTLTSLLAIELSVSQDGITRHCRFVVNAQLVGSPPDRIANLLSSVLSGRGDVVQYLLVLLGERTFSVSDGSTRSGAAVSAIGAGTGDDAIALLEPLLRTLDRDPGRLEYMERFLADLTAGGMDETIPAAVRAVFEPIMAVAREAR